LVTALPARIKQVLLNLVGNGVKYTPTGGRVCITVTTPLAETASGRAAPEVVVTVTDSGPGIRAADLPYVFHKFYRARSATDAGPRPCHRQEHRRAAQRPHLGGKRRGQRKRVRVHAARCLSRSQLL